MKEKESIEGGRMKDIRKERRQKRERETDALKEMKEKGFSSY